MEGRKGGGKNRAQRARAQTYDPPRAKQEFPAARHESCLDKQAFPYLQIADRLGRLPNSICGVFCMILES